MTVGELQKLIQDLPPWLQLEFVAELAFGARDLDFKAIEVKREAIMAQSADEPGPTPVAWEPEKCRIILE